jgi:hypothetical protein
MATGTRLLYFAYFAGQALIAAGWWVVMFVQPDLIPTLMPKNTPDWAFFAFVLPDLPLFIGGSALVAVGLIRQATWLRTVLLVHWGAAAYATLYTWAAHLQTGEALLAAVLMSPSLLVPLVLWRRLQ